MKLAPFALLALVSLASCTQPKSKPPVNPTEADMKKHMEMMAELGQPGPMHKVLTDRAGEYTIKVQMWMDAADRKSPPMESTGEATFKPVLGGRFLMHEETASLAGEKITSIKYWGYSRDRNRFEAAWSYTGSTSMMILDGTTADDGKTVRYTSDIVAAGEKERYEIVVTQISPDSFSIELVGIMSDGTMGAALISTYTRKK